MRMNTGKKLFLCAGLLAFFLSVSAQSYSLRTNVIGLATTNLNLEASMTLNRKWSLHLPVQYNPFKFGVTRNFAASLFRNIKYFTLRKLYLCRKWMQKRLQKTTTTGITLPNFDFLA